LPLRGFWSGIWGGFAVTAILSYISYNLVHRIKILKRTKKGIKFRVTCIEVLSKTEKLLLDVVQLVKADAKLLESFTAAEFTIEPELVDLQGDLPLKANRN
jgi:hypothetical protein